VLSDRRNGTFLSRHRLLASASRRAAWRPMPDAAAESGACGRGNAVGLTSPRSRTDFYRENDDDDDDDEDDE